MYVGSLKFLKSILNKIITTIVIIVIIKVNIEVFQNKKYQTITVKILLKFSNGSNTESFSTL
jgi:hypothetical protein